jgi:two-component system, NtrC family, sensor histidine kinase HydH
MPPSRSRQSLYAATFALPAILIFSSVRTFRELDAQREVYLRERTATIAGRLEAATAGNQPVEAVLASLGEDEPHLRDLRITRKSDSAGDPGLAAVWSGRELFHTQFVDADGGRLYRAYVPFHAGGAMNVVQIDLDVSAADFLLVHAWHNVLISSVGGAALILISIYSIWAAGRVAAAERTQMQMQHLAKLGTMSAVLAHEIRNPLGTIKGFAQLALERGGDAVRPLLVPVLDQTSRLEDLVNDLLVYGRPPVPSFRPVQWNDLAARIELHAKRLAADKSVDLQIAKSELQLQSDPVLLEHILMNLVRNAIDAAADSAEARVSVSAEAIGNLIHLAVRDSGPGIAEQDRGKVREPFFTTKPFGTGLGLPITERLTESLRGTLSLDAMEPCGTVAIVRLPQAT